MSCHGCLGPVHTVVSMLMWCLTLAWAAEPILAPGHPGLKAQVNAQCSEESATECSHNSYEHLVQYPVR